jgi:hypothetical protein
VCVCEFETSAVASGDKQAFQDVDAEKGESERRPTYVLEANNANGTSALKPTYNGLQSMVVEDAKKIAFNDKPQAPQRVVFDSDALFHANA